LAEKINDSRFKFKRIILKALTATVKATLFYAIYFILWMFFDPVSAILPDLHMMVETFVVVYIVLMIIGDLTSGTIFQHFFTTAKSLFVICYLLISLQGGVMTITFQNMNLMVDLRIILTVATILGLLGFAKAMVQAIDYMNERAELTFSA
jgi:hypothetical protein